LPKKLGWATMSFPVEVEPLELSRLWLQDKLVRPDPTKFTTMTMEGKKLKVRGLGCSYCGDALWLHTFAFGHFFPCWLVL
jgi:hypothetical protein